MDKRETVNNSVKMQSVNAHDIGFDAGVLKQASAESFSTSVRGRQRASGTLTGQPDRHGSVPETWKPGRGHSEGRPPATPGRSRPAFNRGADHAVRPI